MSMRETPGSVPGSLVVCGSDRSAVGLLSEALSLFPCIEYGDIRIINFSLHDVNTVTKSQGSFAD